MQLNAVQTDACGGIEVADGDPQEGGQYRYIVSNIFPYNLQESLSMIIQKYFRSTSTHMVNVDSY